MIEYLFLLPLIWLGTISSYTDVKEGMIRNKHIMIALKAAIAIHIIVIIWYRQFNPSGYLHYFTNGIFMLLISFIFWNIGLWTAGDAKLFFAFNILSPPIFIREGYMGMFYGIVYFTNIFGLLLIYFTYKVIRNISMKEFKRCVKDTFNLRSIMFIGLFVFAIGAIMEYIPAPGPSNFLTSSLIFFVILMILQTFAKGQMFKLIAVMAVLRVILDYQDMVTPGFWLNILGQLAILLIAMFLLLRASFYAFTKDIKVNELREKMMLAEDIFPETRDMRDEKGKKKTITVYKKRRIENLTIFAYLQNEPFKLPDYNKNLGLSKNNLEWIRKNKRLLRFAKIRIYETMPFAPLVFSGVLATILFQGNIFIQIARIFIGS